MHHFVVVLKIVLGAHAPGPTMRRITHSVFIRLAYSPIILLRANTHAKAPCEWFHCSLKDIDTNQIQEITHLNKK